jgi:hypothetical protein
MGSHRNSQLQEDWSRLAAESFAFEILDTLQPSTAGLCSKRELRGTLGQTPVASILESDISTPDIEVFQLTYLKTEIVTYTNRIVIGSIGELSPAQ